MCMERQLLRINHSNTQDLSYLWCACMQVLHRKSLFLLDRESCAFSNSNLFGQKSVFTLSCKFLQTLIHTEKTRKPIINVNMVFHRCSVFFYRKPLHKTCENTGFHRTILFLYGRIRISENPYFLIFYAVGKGCIK